VRVEVHAVPGAKVRRVAGSHDGRLIVRVTQRAIDGRATAAVLDAVAAALGVHSRDVTLVAGATSRRKVLDVSGDDVVLGERLGALLDEDS